MLTLDKIYQASYALKTVIRRTDLISAPNINPESHIFLKPENLQVTGSFKVRGACFKIAQLTEEEKSHGCSCSVYIDRTVFFRESLFHDPCVVTVGHVGYRY